ncbi:Chaperone protein DnaJ [Labilithrix luteola]|uniref:Chaperone protein DnaJ n=1 Tax=Labilithrix luteola TaxID=1391654 RepID=A0A0K1PS26_9BACT|nr:molecular chaperone DnaJ [Labilithrix luteola]AKU95929.1 Chaperone protein DnaJ [Labilithrix luteola]
MSHRDHYEVLGVSRSATQEEIKVAFRKQAAVHHPDRNPDDPKAAIRFKELNAAYQVLADPQRRSMYDRFGHRAEEPGSPFSSGGPFAGGVVDFSEIAIDGILGDLLGVFGVGRGDKGDLKRELEITFEEAAFGVTKTMTYDRIVGCTDCRGSGSAPGYAADTCDACNGRGRVRFQQGILPIAVERVCQRCKGKGSVVTHPCSSCRGSGLMKSANTIEVTIPPGVEHGATRVVSGAGNRPRPDKPAGDLELEIQVAAHPFFRRAGDDVLCTVPVTFTQAALGAEVEVPTLDGRGKLRVPAGTQPGTTLRIKNKGMPKRAGIGRGDQRIEVTVEVPTSLTPRQRELLEELAKELGEDVSPQRRGFMDKLRDFFG